jgi:hypothetical protein
MMKLYSPERPQPRKRAVWQEGAGLSLAQHLAYSYTLARMLYYNTLLCQTKRSCIASRANCCSYTKVRATSNMRCQRRRCHLGMAAWRCYERRKFPHESGPDVC